MLPRDGGSADHASVLAGLRAENWNIAMHFGPDMPARRIHQALPVRAFAQTKASTNDHGFRVQHVDQQADG